MADVTGRGAMSGTEDEGERSRDRFRHLPDPPRPADLVEEHPVSPPVPFDGERNVEQDAALHAGG